jgi:hypothetical protein
VTKDDDRFVSFGPKQVPKADGPDPAVPSHLHPVVRFFVRAWRAITRPAEDYRKLWSSAKPRDEKHEDRLSSS